MRILHIKTGTLNASSIIGILSSCEHEIIDSIDISSDIYTANKRLQPDVIVANLKHPNTHFLKHLGQINRDMPTPVVIFSESDDNSLIESSIKAGVNAYVVDGFEPQRINPIITAAVARFRETMSLRQNLDKTKAELADRKVIERAKGILMQARSLSEEDAYKAIRKQAMDQNKRISEIAEAIIATANFIV